MSKPLTITAVHLHHLPDADALGRYWLSSRFGSKEYANFNEVPVREGNPDRTVWDRCVRIDLDVTNRPATPEGVDTNARDTAIDVEAGILPTEDAWRARLLTASHGHRDAEGDYWSRSSMGLGYKGHFLDPGRSIPPGLERLVTAVHLDDTRGQKIGLVPPYSSVHPSLALFKYLKKGIHHRLIRNPDEGEVGTWAERPLEEVVDLACQIYDAIAYALAEAEAGRPFDVTMFNTNKCIAEWVCEYLELQEEAAGQDVGRLSDPWLEEKRKREKFAHAWNGVRAGVRRLPKSYLKSRVFPPILEWCDGNHFPLANPDDIVFTLPFWYGAIYRYRRDVMRDRDAMENTKATFKRLLDGFIWLVRDNELSTDEVVEVQTKTRALTARVEAGEVQNTPYLYPWQSRQGLVLMRGASRRSQFASNAHYPGDANIVLVERADETGRLTGNWYLSFKAPRVGAGEDAGRIRGTFTAIIQHIVRMLRVKELVARKRSDLLSRVDLNTPGDFEEVDREYEDRIFVFVPDRWMEDLYGVPKPMWVFNGSDTHPKKPTAISTDEVWRTIIECVEAWVPAQCAYRQGKGAHCDHACPFFRRRWQENFHACYNLRMRAHGGTYDRPGEDFTTADAEWFFLRLAKGDVRRAKELRKAFDKDAAQLSGLGEEDLATLLTYAIFGSSMVEEGEEASYHLEGEQDDADDDTDGEDLDEDDDGEE